MLKHPEDNIGTVYMVVTTCFIYHVHIKEITPILCKGWSTFRIEVGWGHNHMGGVHSFWAPSDWGGGCHEITCHFCIKWYYFTPYVPFFRGRTTDLHY